MKTKEEIIKDAYGEYWDKLPYLSKQNALVENGWLDFQDFKDCGIAELKFDGRMSTSVYHINLECDEEDNSFFRPLVLKGIENNNGWIKVDNIEEFPTHLMECYVFDYDGDISYFTFGLNPNQDKVLIENGITHYQPIIKPKPPLY